MPEKSSNKILLLCGVSGAGKSSIISELVRTDNRFACVMPYTTRLLRLGETNKVHVPPEKFEEMERKHEFVITHSMFNNRYGTPKQPIKDALRSGRFPVFEYTINTVDRMRTAFPGRIFCVYVNHEQIQVLIERMMAVGRDNLNERIADMVRELDKVKAGEFDSTIDFKIANQTGMLMQVAAKIKEEFLRSTAKAKE